MTIPSTARKAGPLLGNGVQTTWPFTFKVFAETDVKVTIADANGVETVLTSNYSVALNPNQETSPGGTVTYPVSGDELPTGSVLSITGDIDYDQPLDLPGGGNFNPLAIENQLDRNVMQIQQLREELDRAARLPVTSSADADALVADIVRLADSADNIDAVAAVVDDVNTVADNVESVNTVGDNITHVIATSANIAAVITVATDLNEPVSEIEAVAGAITNVNAVGGNIAAVATVAADIADVSAVAAIAADVSAVADSVADVTNFADVYQGAHATDPTLRNNGGALQSGDLYFNTTENALRAYSGTVWVSGTAGSVSVQTFSGDDVETEFTLTTAPASENNAQVYVGGVYQQKSQFSIAGVTLTFSSPPPVGADNIEVVTLSSLALGETDAALVSFTPVGSIAATNVQAAINELDAEKQAAMSAASQDEMEAGTEAALRAMSPLRVGQAIAALSPVTAFSSSAENIAGAVEGKAVDPLGIREAFNAAGTAPVFACRAWVNFNGTSAGTFAGGASTVSRTSGSTTATVTTTNAHGLITGNVVQALSGVVAGTYTVTVTGGTTFTITTVATTVLTAAEITFAFLAINAAGNVSSVADTATGVPVVNFATPMPDANYSSVLNARNAGDSTASSTLSAAPQLSSIKTTTAFQFFTRTTSAADAPEVNAVFFR